MTFDINKWVKDHLLEESATGHGEVREVGQSAVSSGQGGTTSRREITLIQPGWGSSGYYSKEVLRTDGPKAWPKGTHMYMNHPTRTEETDRPERDVRDLAAVLKTDPKPDATGALVAEAEIFPHWDPVIDAVAKDIGVSIRAIGDYEEGEAEGRTGRIITSLDEGISVDFVTRAGAGGKVGSLIESAWPHEHGPQLEEARNANDYMQSRMHSDFTSMADRMYGDGYLTRDERKGVSAGLGKAMDAFHGHIQANHPQLLKRDPYDDPSGTAPVHASEVLREADAVWAEEDTGLDRKVLLQKAQERINESRRRTGGAEGGTPVELDEATKKQLNDLQEAQKQLETRLEESESKAKDAETRADRAEDALLESEARGVVEKTIREGQEGENPLPKLPERATERVVEAALKAKLPLGENGKLDKDAMEKRVREAAKTEHEYLAPSSAEGKVRGAGGSPVSEAERDNGGNGDEQVSEADQKKLEEAFAGLGSSEKAAAIAARGR